MQNDLHKTGAQTVHRAVELLQYVARFPGEGVRLVDIAKALDIERPTAHRVLRALAVEGLITQDASRRYRVGPLVFALNLMSGGHFNLVDACMPALCDLAEQTGDTSFLFVRYGDEALCIARKQGWYHIQTPVVAVGSCHPIGVSAGGLAILAALSEDTAASLLRDLAPKLPAFNGLTEADVWTHYCKARARGYAVIADRAASGVKGVGVPILNALGNPIAGVTVATTVSRMTEEKVSEVAPLLRIAASAIAERMQHHAVSIRSSPHQ